MMNLKEFIQHCNDKKIFDAREMIKEKNDLFSTSIGPHKHAVLDRKYYFVKCIDIYYDSNTGYKHFILADNNCNFFIGIEKIENYQHKKYYLVEESGFLMTYSSIHGFLYLQNKNCSVICLNDLVSEY